MLPKSQPDGNPMTRPLVPLLLAALVVPSVLSAQEAAPAGTPGDRAGRHAVADAHADAAPTSVEQSVPALAAYLAQAGRDNLTRARALYRWVAGHIEYDASGFRTASYGDVSPEGVLRRRASVCEGYARLTEALGEAMGLEIEVVSGWSKGYGYTPGQRFDGATNHAWNAVRIEGQWRLMDPTWGAGYLDERMQFVRRFQEHYFLTPPDAFVFDHLPQDQRWQLLERPVSAAEYTDLAYLRPMFFVAGFRIGSHARARIAADDRVTVTLGVTQPVQLAARVVDAATDRPLEGDYAFAQVNDTEAQIHAAFPRPGDYLLRLFAQPRGAAGALQWVLDYRVQASRGAPDAVFPLAYTGFGASGTWLVEPFSGVLEAGRPYRFRLRAPGALEVAVVAGGQWTHFTREGEEFSADVPAVAGNIVVYAKYDPNSDFTGLLRYTAR
jgi:transglutaminase/protease-like cytokinesis protein 3